MSSTRKIAVLAGVVFIVTEIAAIAGLLRSAVEHEGGPWSIRYPRDASPDEPRA